MTKKLSQIFYLVSIIITAIDLVCFIVIGIMTCAVIPSLYASGKLNLTVPDALAQYFTTQEFVSFIATYYSTLMFSLAVFSIVSIVVTILARKKQTNVLHILSIVFGVLSNGPLAVAAGILGLISAHKSNNEEVINQETIS